MNGPGRKVAALAFVAVVVGCRGGGERHETRLTLPASARGPALAGTLTLPSRGCPCPVAVLVPGIGSHDRDYTLFGHHFFADLADSLAAQGIGTLRYDERGIGQSGGQPGRASPPELAGDVLAWLDLLRAREDVDPDHLGIVGHSEGGIVGTLAAARNPGLAFLVMLATPGLPGRAYNLQYEASVGRAMGLDEESVEAKRVFQSRVLDVLLGDGEDSVKADTLRATYGRLRPPVPPVSIDRTVAHLLSPRFLFNLSYDPSKALAGVRVPTLAVFGAKDVQVPPEGNAKALEAALDVGSGRNRVVVFPGLNHFFQRAVTGSPQEYADLEGTWAPEVVDAVVLWIRRHSGPRR